jgi:hypothetical protein
MKDSNGMVKVRFHGTQGCDSETLWVLPVSDDVYQLENSPFFAYGVYFCRSAPSTNAIMRSRKVSWKDLIKAKPGKDQFPEYVGCVKKSGNRTLRIIFQDFRSSEQPAQAILKQLTELGCSYEGMQPRLISINVPPEVELQRVTDFLKNQSGTQWEYADPTYDEITKTRPV